MLFTLSKTSTSNSTEKMLKNKKEVIKLKEQNELNSKEEIKECASTIVLNSDKKLKREQNKPIKNLVRKELSNEAIQSLLKIFFSTNIILRLFWIVCVIVSTGLCSYLIVQSIFTYLTFGVTTTTLNIVENPTNFPKITICK